MKQRLNFAGIVPARHASSRFPGKPLAMIGNKPMIRLVYEQASRALETVFVATDHAGIYETVISFGGRAVMTSPDHQSGTDRCAEAMTLIRDKNGIPVDVIINIQGDEPFIRPEQIRQLMDCFSDDSVSIATLVRKVNPGEEILDPNQVKALIALNGDAIYFSRLPVPYFRGAPSEKWTEHHTYYKHLGLYAYRAGTLESITQLPRTSLEKAESLEQNRWIENGFRIRTAITEWESIGIDTPEDLEKAKRFLERND